MYPQIKEDYLPISTCYHDHRLAAKLNHVPRSIMKFCRQYTHGPTKNATSRSRRQHYTGNKEGQPIRSQCIAKHRQKRTGSWIAGVFVTGIDTKVNLRHCALSKLLFLSTTEEAKHNERRRIRLDFGESLGNQVFWPHFERVGQSEGPNPSYLLVFKDRKSVV